MNRKFALSLVVAAAAAGNAFADDITVDPTPFVSSRSRAEVQAELSQFKKAGVNPWSISYNQLRGIESRNTRQQVVGEYLAARGRVAAMTGEDSGSAYLKRQAAASSTTLAGQPQRAL